VKPLAPSCRRIAFAVIAVAAVAAAVGTFLIPPDEKLGALVRLVMFHGGSTWVNMATFTLAGIAGLAFVLGVGAAKPWGEGFRWVSLPLWIVNSILGLLSMQLIWGGILWDEPRLFMTFGVLIGAVLILALQLIFDAPKLIALLDAALAGTLWTLVLVLPNLFHPDSPVFSSGDARYIGLFLAVVASLFVGAVAIATLIARRRVSEVGE
jgi:hypothetical protein